MKKRELIQMIDHLLDRYEGNKICTEKFEEQLAKLHHKLEKNKFEPESIEEDENLWEDGIYDTPNFWDGLV